MVVDQDVAREYLQRHMIPGVWYRQNQLHDLFESVYDKWEPVDDTPLESEPNRERWRRFVGNCLRMSPDYGSFSDNSWTTTHNPTPVARYNKYIGGDCWTSLWRSKDYHVCTIFTSV